MDTFAIPVQSRPDVVAAWGVPLNQPFAAIPRCARWAFRLFSARQRRARTVRDRLFGQVLILGRDGVGLHDDDVIVVELENIRRESHAYRVSLAPDSVHYHPHIALLDFE